MPPEYCDCKSPVWRGSDGQGLAGRGRAQQGKVGHGFLYEFSEFGRARRGVAWMGVARPGGAWQGFLKT